MENRPGSAWVEFLSEASTSYSTALTYSRKKYHTCRYTAVVPQGKKKLTNDGLAGILSIIVEMFAAFGLTAVSE